MIAVGLLVPAVLTIAGAAWYGLAEVQHVSRHLYEDTLEVTNATARLDSALAAVAERSVEASATDDPARAAALDRQLDQVWVPHAEDALRTLSDYSQDEDEGRSYVEEIRVALAEYEGLRASGAYRPTADDPVGRQRRAATLRRTSELFDRMHRGSEQRLAFRPRLSVECRHWGESP